MQRQSDSYEGPDGNDFDEIQDDYLSGGPDDDELERDETDWGDEGDEGDDDDDNDDEDDPYGRWQSLARERTINAFKQNPGLGLRVLSGRLRIPLEDVASFLVSEYFDWEIRMGILENRINQGDVLLALQFLGDENSRNLASGVFSSTRAWKDSVQNGTSFYGAYSLSDWSKSLHLTSIQIAVTQIELETVRPPRHSWNDIDVF